MNTDVTADEKAEFVALYRDGKTFAEIVAVTGRSLSSVLKYIGKSGVMRRVQHHACDRSYFRSIDTTSKAYWLGFLAADAAITAGPKKWCLTLTLADRDRAHVEPFQSAMGSTHPVTHKILAGRPYARFDVTCVELVKDLIRHGVGPAKSHTMVPWDGPPPLVRHYWRGVWDGDGSFTKAGWMSLVGSRATMAGFQKYAKDRLGIEVPVRPHKSIFDLRFWKLAEVAALASHLYRDLDGAPVLARKAERAETAIARTPKLNDWSHLTAEALAGLKAKHGTWGVVATSLGIKSYCVLWKVRKRLGV